MSTSTGMLDGRYFHVWFVSEMLPIERNSENQQPGKSWYHSLGTSPLKLIIRNIYSSSSREYSSPSLLHLHKQRKLSGFSPIHLGADVALSDIATPSCSQAMVVVETTEDHTLTVRTMENRPSLVGSGTFVLLISCLYMSRRIPSPQQGRAQ